MLRFAPSPTGDMHITTLRIAVLSYLVAQQRQESFGVRIDDIDKTETIEGKDTEIMQILEKFALKHDSVFHQSEHLHMHQTLAIKLLEEEKAFVCTCIKEEVDCSRDCEILEKSEYTRLKESKKPFVIRIKKPKESIVLHDIIQGNLTASPDEVGTFIILQKDGTPSPLFASACDDILSGVNFILDEKKHLNNTPKQIHIKTQLGYKEEIVYAHIPAIYHKNESDTPLSVKWLFEQGYIPDAIINYILFASNPQAPTKIFTLPEAMSWFKLEEISPDDITFDHDILRSINKEHLMKIEDKLLSSLFGFADADVGKLVKLYLQECCTINELALRIRPIFAPKAIENEWKEEMILLQKVIMDAPMLDTYDTFIAYLIKESGLTDEKLFTPLRLLLTGAKHGPELSDIYPLIKSYLLEVAS